MTILNIQSSSRRDGSTTRLLSEELISALAADRVITRDLADGVPFIDDGWIAANFTPEEERTAAQAARLSFSDQLIEEIAAADTLVIGAPMYNFSVPAALKAWIDLVARARKTFQYAENGPVGLLKNKRAFVVTATGGVPAGAPADFLTGYLRHVLGFIGITDVTFIAADRQMADPGVLDRARAEIAISRRAAALKKAG